MTKTKTYYHVTLTDNIPDISEQGLCPCIGPLSVNADEPIPRIYLFPTAVDMENALMNWFGEAINEEYGEETSFTALEITLPTDFLIEEPEDLYECYSYDVIPAKYIKIYKDV